MRRSSVKTLVKSEELNVKQTSAVSDQSPVSMREFQKLSSGGTIRATVSKNWSQAVITDFS